MDATCLIGLCAAAAQTVAEAGATAAADPAAPASAAHSDGARDFSQALVWLGILTVLAAQIAAPWSLKRYRRRLLGFMGSASRKALGLAELAVAEPWTASRLLGAMERQRRRVLGVLVAVVLVYAVGAALAWGYVGDDSKVTLVSRGVSFLMFASLSAPVVLLGVSAANFGRLFWVWVAPVAFASIAMQIVVINGIGGDGEDWRTTLKALLLVVSLTVLAVAVRELAPAAWWQRAVDWMRGHRRSAVALGALGVLLLLALIGWVSPESAAPADAGAVAGGEGGEVGIGGTGTDNALEAVRDLRLNAWQKTTLGLLAAAAAILGCYLTLVDRIKRILVPLIAVGLFTLLTAAALIGMALLADAPAWAVLPGALLALLLAWLPATFVLSWVGLAYERKLFSDAQFQVFCWMLAISGVVIGIETQANDSTLFDPLSLWLFAATAGALLLYWLVTRYGLAPLDSNKRLLVLRVFAQDHRGEQLLDEIEYRWRFIGPIVLIGGPDIAARTIDPGKAAHFLRLKLRDTFVPSLHVLHKQVAAMDETPDPDGRYRVNEFFCFDDIWKEAVQLLLDSSDAVVLDLRGFTAARRGTAYELGLLMARGALPRTVFLVNRQTDLQAVREALGVPSDRPLPAGNVIEVDSAMDGHRLVEALVHRIPAAPRPTARPDPALIVA
jgi:hypothetical protein